MVQLILCGMVGVGILGFHFYYAWTRDNRSDAVVYTCSRVSILAFYTVTVIVGMLPGNGYSFHIHHFFIAFACGLFCQYNHWVSLATLAITAGIMVQGLGSYGPASLFTEETRCAEWVDKATGQYMESDYFSYYPHSCHSSAGAPKSHDVPPIRSSSLVGGLSLPEVVESERAREAQQRRCGCCCVRLDYLQWYV